MQVSKVLKKLKMEAYKVVRPYLDQERVSHTQDAILNLLLDRAEEDPSLIKLDEIIFKKEGKFYKVFTVKICDRTYWVSNFPYSFGYATHHNDMRKKVFLLPTVETRWRFMEILTTMPVFVDTRKHSQLPDFVFLKKRGDELWI